MSKKATVHGKVLEGDYKGANVFNWDDYSFMIVDGDVETGFLALPPKKLQEISKETVERYEEISATKNGPDATAAMKGALLGGPFLGAIAAMASQSETYDIAIYFKDGKKSLIRLFYSSCYQSLKQKLFSF